ncbi:MAG TPA: DNA-directed RNA polymerase subunit beta' [Thermoanaerobaculia bacterium]|nr:DNA-directed RNA polymerase subunit beta' [Thermoanaerobaculia bacterium]
MESFNALFQPTKPQAINDFNAIKISLASPEKIRSWSYGEVTKPETINYRTFKPERDGLFCAKIFGPITDWECLCGKYKRMKHRGVICDKCGVEVTKSKVRRERMGHIELASPVSHVWFFKGLPSRIGHLLDISLRDLERILYFESYVVIDSGDLSNVINEKELLAEERYRELRTQYGDVFVAKMGAEAIKELLRRVNVEELSDELRLIMRTETSQIKKLKAAKRLKVVDAFRKSGHRPEWMILDVIPVIPPELRPLVPLDGGRFATSDLNDLYRRVINRNNRLKKLLELRAPDVIVRNEKRMLEEAVDALFDNGRRGRVLKGSNNRPLKSLSDTLKGKQGRFRQNLLGKRVDYSGRSVIVVGPELKLHQCGLPKKMALELFKPFIYNRLEQKGLVGTIKAAKEMVELQQTEVWDALEEVIKEHPVLLNRAPTLHRLGIQAFEPILVEGKAIKLHPLVCTAFNADFDGDQMAVHVPLSPKAQVESQVLMLASNNILSPANGKPLAVPSQDLVLGCYYLTKEKKGAKGEGKVFGSIDEVVLALSSCEVELLTPIRVRISGKLIDLTKHYNDQDVLHAEIQEVEKKLIETTVGRVIFNMTLPEEIPYINGLMKKKGLQDLVNFTFLNWGNALTVSLLDELKNLGFLYATKAGISIGVDDMVIPSKKQEIVEDARKSVLEVERQRLDGAITAGERHNKIIDIWHRATENVSDEMFAEMRRTEQERQEFNPIFMMADSGARGSKEQVRQLAGMRGLMSKPSGEVIETPITANFREGLSVLQYFISTHGARKGLADTALKTADSGYLTRRLVDVAQDVIVTEEDCQTFDGITVTPIMEGGDILEPLRDRVVGRVGQEDIYDPLSGTLIVGQNDEISEDLANEIQEAGIEQVKIRSVLTCETRRGVCRRCYGRNLASGKLVEIGEAVGVIAAESIGEPGTQLTMRTFHVGGTASRVSEQSKHEASSPGRVTLINVNTVTNKNGDLVVINRNGKLIIVEDIQPKKQPKKGEHIPPAAREKERYALVYGSTLKVHEGQHVNAGDPLVEWDPFTSAILTEVGGKVSFKDIVEGENVREETDKVTGLTQMVIVESSMTEKRTPTITVKSKKGEEKKYLLPTGAHVMVQNGHEVYPGDILAKIPRATTKTKDITGGLPRVVELFEARHPREKAVISEVDGAVHHGPIVKGLRRIIVETEEGTRHEYSVPRSVHVNVQEGEHLRAGDPLIDGPIDPHDILAVLGIKELQRYLVDKIQEVYRSQSVAINDKHIEVICRQMLRSVRVTRVGDTDFLVDEQVDRFRFMEENEKVMNRGGEPADGTPLLLGITKASLSTASFISAASFQETTRVLTEAAIAGRVDYLRGLKENVIVGRLIPAGTGMPAYREIYLEKDEPAPQPQLEDLLRPEDEEALSLADFDDEQ